MPSVCRFVVGKQPPLLSLTTLQPRPPSTFHQRFASFMAGPPLRASLEGIPPELRNNIYNKVAADLDEVSIIGRKLKPMKANCSEEEAKGRMWHAIAKHPLAQTSRTLRKEFNPIHRYHVMVKGVTKYILELENYDLDRMERLADLVVLTGPLLEHLRTKLTAEKFVIRFLLNGHVEKSVPVLEKYARTPARLGRGYAKLKSVFPPGCDYWSWEVVLNLYDKSMSAAQKAMATSHKQELYVRRVFGDLSGNLVYGDHKDSGVVNTRIHRYYVPHTRVSLVRHVSSKSDKQVAIILWEYHQKANAGFQAAKQEMHRVKMQKDVRDKLRDKLRQSVRKELQQIVRQEVKDELRREMDVESFKEKEEMKQDLKETIKQELKDELGKELMARMRTLFV